MTEHLILKIKPIQGKIAGYDECWYFLKDTRRRGKLFTYRWIIGYNKETDWWGVVPYMTDTYYKALDRITDEMKLAKKAIKILQKQKMKKIKLDNKPIAQS